jgi:predicted enzyme related to lactoylglutathione lyase
LPNDARPPILALRRAAAKAPEGETMTDNDTGRFVWFELMTTDPKGAIAFYTEVIGWKTQPWEGNDYTMWLAGQGPLGGVTLLPERAKQFGAPPHWQANVHVADVDATVARVRELGGRTYVDPVDVPKIGRIAVIADPQGAAIAVVKLEQSMPAHDTEKHGEFCWSELLTTDQEAAFAFYSAIFGWERLLDHDLGPMGNYLIYGRHGKQLGGIFTIPKGMPMPPAFLHYVQVDDLDAALARAKKLGATALNGPMEVPGGARIVQLKDPQGAAISLHENAKPAR